MDRSPDAIPIRILIVDDTPANLLAYREILEQPDWTVITVDNGGEALQEALKADLAVILLDVRMPGMSGLELAQILRSRDCLKFTPIIFMSAHDRMPADVAHGYLAGGIDYLFSPVDADLLKHKVTACVELYLRNAALRRENAALRTANEQLKLNLLKFHQNRRIS
ncbi:MAG TPA: response regulator [Planctomycetota bacterium]|jgi:DNA-binding response OmpR family regulator|nr:response regulator [Planctomycetota bacterium]